MEKVVLKTNYNEEILKDFIKFHFKKINLTMLVCGAIIFLLGICSVFLVSIVTGIIFSIVGIFFMFYPKILQIASLNANRRIMNAEDEYVFDKDSMHVTSVVFGEEVANQDIKYKALENIKADAKYIFLYVNKASAMIIKRSDLTQKQQEFIISNIKQFIHIKKK